MTDQPQQPPAIDPDNIPETLCDGQFNVSIVGNFATLTFTHVRPDAAAMFRDGTVDPKSVVRARIVVTLANLEALRALLERVLRTPETPTPPAGGPTRH